jgi:hypothetical protein
MIRTALRATLLLLACTAPAVGQAGVHRRDSAGVRIVTNDWPLAHPSEVRVGGAPSKALNLDKCAAGGKWIDIRGGGEFADGTMLVVDGTVGGVCFFAPDGTFRFRFGHFGHGAAVDEFDYITNVFHPAGDLIYVADGRTNRVTSFDRRGNTHDWIRTDELPRKLTAMGMVRGLLTVRGRMADGTLIAEAAGPAVHSATTVATDSLDIRVFAPVRKETTSARVLARSWVFRNGPTGEPPIDDDLPFAPKGAVGVGSAAWYYSAGESLEIQKRSPTGAVTALFRVNVLRLPVTEAEVATFKRQFIAEQPAKARASAAIVLDSLRFSHFLPGYTDLKVDIAGDLWAERWGTPAEPHQWDIIRPDGILIGDVALPPRSHILDIGLRSILLLDVTSEYNPQIREYPLERGASAPP